jgi:hypothetical protein
VDVLATEYPDGVAVFGIDGDVLGGPSPLPAFLELLVEDVVLLQVACEFQSRIGEHHPERALDVFRPGGRVDLIESANELRSDVLLVGISQMLGTELDGFSLAVVTIVDFDDATTGFIDDDAVWSAIVLIEITDDAYEKQESENDAAAREVNNSANILWIAVDGRESHRLTFSGGTRNGRDTRLVALDLSFVQHKVSLGSVDYVISDEDGKRSWIGHPVWSDFWKKLAQEVVNDSKVLLASDDDYLFPVIARDAGIVAKAKAAHGRRERQPAFRSQLRQY